MDAAEWLNWMNNNVVRGSDDEGKFHFNLLEYHFSNTYVVEMLKRW